MKNYIGFPLIFKIILAVFLLILVVASLQYYNYRRTETIKRFQDRLSTITELKVAQIQAWKEERIREGFAISDNKFLIEQLVRTGEQKYGSPVAEITLETMDYYLMKFELLSLHYFDSDNILRISRGEVHSGLEEHLLNSVNESASSKQMIMGKICIDEFTRLHFPLIIPIYINEIFHGTLIAEVPTDHFFNNVIIHWPLHSETSEILLVSDDSSHVLFISSVKFPESRDKILRIEKSYSDLPAVKAVDGYSGFVEGTDYRNVPVLAYVDSIPGTGWYIVAKTDKAEAFSELTDLSLWLILTSSFLILTALLSTIALWKNSTSRFYKRSLELEKEKKSIEKYLSYMSKYANDIIFMLRPDGSIHKSNDKACEVYGYTPNEFAEMTVFDLHFTNESGLVDNQLQSIMKSGSAFFEAVHIKKDGTPFPVEINSRVITLHGETFIFSVVRDVTERKRTEEELKQSEKKYRYLFENNPQPMWIYDLETLAFLEVNNAAVKQYGYSKDEFLSITLKEIRPEEDIPSLLKDVEKIADDLNNAGIWRHKKKNGEIIFVEITSHKIRYLDKDARLVLAFDITKRKKAEEALRETEEKLREVLEHSVNMFYSHTPDHVLTYVSPQSLKYLGCTPEEAKTRWTEFVTDNPVNQTGFEITQKAIDTGIAQPPYELELRKKNGEIIWVEVREAPVVKYGKTVAIVGSLTDITEKRSALLALNESEKKYRILVENLNDIVYKVDENGIITFISSAAEKITGYSTEEILGKPFDIFINPDEKHKARENFEKLVMTDHIEDDFTIITKSGSSIYVRISSTGMMENGIFKGAIGVLVDITEKKLASDALKQSEEKFRSIAESAKDLIYVFRLLPEPEFEYVSPSSEKIVGYSPEEHYADPYLGMKIIHPEDESKLKEVTLSKQSITNLQLRWIHKDGKVVWIESTIVKKINEEGKIELIYGIARDITDRILFETKLAESERRYKALFEHANEAIFLLDPVSYLFIDCNPAASRLFDLDKNELVGKPPYFFSPEKQADGTDSESLAKRYIDECLINETVRFDWKHVKHNGDIIDSEISLNKVNINSHSLVQAFIRDVTAQKKQEDQIKLLYQSIEQTPASVVMTDLEGNITYVNKKLLEISGFSKEEVIGQNPSIFQSGLTDKKVYDDLWNTVSNGRDWTGQFINKRKNGELYWENALISPVINSQNEIIGYLGIKEDITEKKYQEEILRENEEKFRAMFDNSSEAMFLTQPDGSIEAANPAACRMFQYSEEELIRSGRKAIIDQNDERLSSYIQQRQESGNISGELTFVRKNGEKFTGELSSAMFKDKDGNLKTSTIVRDITVQKKYESALIEAKERAEEMNRLKSSFLANMSHELRTPLMGILGCASILKDEAQDNSVSELSSIIIESGNRLKYTLNAILDLSKLEVENPIIPLHTVSVTETAAEVIKLFEPAASKKNLELKLLKPHNELFATAEATLLRNVLNNLVNNAIKYTKEGSVICSLSESENNIRITVSDTGIGIPEKYVSTVFEPFRQVSEGYSREFEGTGLGLTLTKKYVDLLKGTITLKSKVGEGSTFTVILNK